MRKLIAPFGLLLFFTLLLVSCVKNDISSNYCPLRGTQISLLLGDIPVVETRSAASENERWINDAYVLVFSSDDKYKSGEKVTVTTAITNNGQKTPKLSTALPLTDGDKIVVLCNTGMATMPTFTVGTSTITDINDKFPSTDWNINQSGTNSGKDMPMSGKATWNTITPPTIQMYRSVAKIQLSLDIAAGADMTGSFTQATDKVQWGMYNMQSKGHIYSENGALNEPAFQVTDFINKTTLPQRVVGASGATAEQQTFYMPEHSNAHYGKTTYIESVSAFSPTRTCIIVMTTAGYYRIDLVTGNDNDQIKSFFDIQRNYDYQVKITRVRSYGYRSVEEALENPGSNVEYEVEITGSEDNFTTSNGQYAVTTDKSEAAVTEGISTPANLLKFFCKNNNMTNISTRRVLLVGSDKETVIPTSQLQMCYNDGTAISNNTLIPFTEPDETGYQLKYTSPDWASLPSEQVYVMICYGNIRHYVPVSMYKFGVVTQLAIIPILATQNNILLPVAKNSAVLP